MKSIKRIVIFIFIVGVLGAAGGGYWWYQNKNAAVASAAAAHASSTGMYIKFDMEVFDTITREYWQKAN